MRSKAMRLLGLAASGLLFGAATWADDQDAGRYQRFAETLKGVTDLPKDQAKPASLASFVVDPTIFSANRPQVASATWGPRSAAPRRVHPDQILLQFRPDVTADRIN